MKRFLCPSGVFGRDCRPQQTEPLAKRTGIGGGEKGVFSFGTFGIALEFLEPREIGAKLRAGVIVVPPPEWLLLRVQKLAHLGEAMRGFQHQAEVLRPTKV